MALTQIKTDGLANNSVTNAKMADNAIDSVDIAAGSIDNAHLAGSIATTKLTGALTSVGSHGLATSATTDTTNASNIASGTLNKARLPADSDTITSVGTLLSLATSGNVGVGSATTSSPSSASRTLRIQHATGSASLVLCGDNDHESAWDILADTDGALDIRKNNYSQLKMVGGSSATFSNNVRIEGSSTTRYLFFNSGDNCGVWNESNTNLRFGTNDTERMKIEGDGTVVMNGALQPSGNVSGGGYLRGNQIGVGKVPSSGYEFDGEVASGNFNMRLKATGTNQGARLAMDSHSGDMGRITFESGGAQKSEIRGTIGDESLKFYTNNANLALTLDNSQNAIFEGNYLYVGSQNSAGNKTIILNGGVWDEPEINFYPYSNFRFKLYSYSNGTTNKKFKLENNANETMFESGGNNSKDFWFGGALSATAFNVRTPYPETLQIAYDALSSIIRLPEGEYKADDKDFQINHSNLHDYVKASKQVSTGLPDDEVVTTELSETEMDMSSVVSCLVEVVRDLTAKVEALENA